MKSILIFVAIIFSGSIEERNKNKKAKESIYPATLQQVRLNKNFLIKQEKTKILEIKEKLNEKQKLTYQIKEKEERFKKLAKISDNMVKKFKRWQNKTKNTDSMYYDAKMNLEVAKNLTIFENIYKLKIEIIQILFELIEAFWRKISLTKRLIFLSDYYRNDKEIPFRLNVDETIILTEIKERFDEMKQEDSDNEYKFELYRTKFNESIINGEDIKASHFSNEKLHSSIGGDKVIAVNDVFEKNSEIQLTGKKSLELDYSSEDDIMKESPSILVDLCYSDDFIEFTKSTDNKSLQNLDESISFKKIDSPALSQKKTSISPQSKDSKDCNDSEIKSRNEKYQQTTLSSQISLSGKKFPTQNLHSERFPMNSTNSKEELACPETVFKNSYCFGPKKKYSINLRLKKHTKKASSKNI